MPQATIGAAAPQAAVAEPAAEAAHKPARGELGIKERRAWKSWHLATACVVMALDYFAFKKIPTSSIIGEKKNERTMDQAPVAQVARAGSLVPVA